MHIKPNQGRQVPDPSRGDILPPEGRTVVPTQYWYRRISDGDVTVATEKSAPKKQAASAETTEGADQ